MTKGCPNTGQPFFWNRYCLFDAQGYIMRGYSFNCKYYIQPVCIIYIQRTNRNPGILCLRPDFRLLVIPLESGDPAPFSQELGKDSGFRVDPGMTTFADSFGIVSLYWIS